MDAPTDPVIVESVRIASSMGFEITAEELVEARKPASPKVKNFFEYLAKDKELSEWDYCKIGTVTVICVMAVD